MAGGGGPASRVLASLRAHLPSLCAAVILGTLILPLFPRSPSSLTVPEPRERACCPGLQCRPALREPPIGTHPSLSRLTPSSSWRNFRSKPGLNLVCSQSDGGLLAVNCDMLCGTSQPCGRGADPAHSSLSLPVQLLSPSAGQSLCSRTQRGLCSPWCCLPGPVALPTWGRAHCRVSPACHGAP